MGQPGKWYGDGEAIFVFVSLLTAELAAYLGLISHINAFLFG
jgi:hypothetical protein